MDTKTITNDVKNEVTKGLEKLTTLRDEVKLHNPSCLARRKAGVERQARAAHQRGLQRGGDRRAHRQRRVEGGHSRSRHEGGGLLREAPRHEGVLLTPAT